MNAWSVETTPAALSLQPLLIKFTILGTLGSPLAFMNFQHHRLNSGRSPRPFRFPLLLCSLESPDFESSSGRAYLICSLSLTKGTMCVWCLKTGYVNWKFVMDEPFWAAFSVMCSQKLLSWNSHPQEERTDFVQVALPTLNPDHIMKEIEEHTKPNQKLKHSMLLQEGDLSKQQQWFFTDASGQH